MIPTSLSRRRRFGLGPLSLRGRLVLWWCALLAVLLTGILWAGYCGVQSVLVETGGDRARMAADQLAGLVARTVQARKDQLLLIADDDAVRRAIQTPTPHNLAAARRQLAPLATPAPCRLTLWTAAAGRLLEIAGPDSAADPNPVRFPVGESPTGPGVRALRPLQPSAAPAGTSAPGRPGVSVPRSGPLVRRDGSTVYVESSAAPIHDRDGAVTGAVIVFRDVSAERAQAQRMAHLAQYDVLTNLPNRTLLDDRIAQATALARRRGGRLSVLFVDLDRFKHINDSLGHVVGDGLLQSVTARLLACVRESDTVSRRGGDEFVILLAEVERRDDAAIVAERILATLAAPHEIVDHLVYVTASLGISVYPEDALEAQALIGAADAAMYKAKECGRGNFQFFTDDMNVRAVARRSLEASLRNAVHREEFVLHYQPKFNLATPAITGVEALIRWQHPMRGLLLPGEFIPVAEECGLMLPIGRWVLRQACRQARAWRDEGLPPRSMAVNVSAIEFRSRGFLDYVAAVLDETGLSPEYFEIEVTEGVLMTNVEATAAVLGGLKDLGIRLAIDDFGTGYSSLSYLSRFPIDTLKIDRSFVAGLTQPGNDATIIHAIIAMGRSMKQCVVAEGIETAAQLAALQAHACGEGQGYYFSRPVPAAQLAEQLRRDPGVGDAVPSCAAVPTAEWPGLGDALGGIAS